MIQKLFYFLFASIVFFTSCGDKENPIPIVPVNMLIQNIEYDAQYQDLKVDGNSVKITRQASCLGYNCNGIIVFRLKTENTADDFVVYDASCPYENGTYSMEIDPYFPDLLTCPNCKSIFTLYGGYMQQGPAKFPLREIPCSFYEGDLKIY